MFIYFTARTYLMDHLQERYGLDRGQAGTVADFAHACGACGIPGTHQRRVQFMEGFGYTIS